jgi:hypothetical protein
MRSTSRRMAFVRVGQRPHDERHTCDSRMSMLLGSTLAAAIYPFAGRERAPDVGHAGLSPGTRRGPKGTTKMKEERRQTGPVRRPDELFFDDER